MEQIKLFFSRCLSSEMFLIVLGVFSVIPFIIISFFNNPAADDFAFPVEIHNHGFIGSQIWWYNNWLGRYFSSFLMSINPLVFNNFFLFKLIPIFLIASLFFSLLYFFYKSSTVNENIIAIELLISSSSFLSEDMFCSLKTRMSVCKRG